METKDLLNKQVELFADLQETTLYPDMSDMYEDMPDPLDQFNPHCHE
jgi:hypothetical protein